MVRAALFLSCSVRAELEDFIPNERSLWVKKMGLHPESFPIGGESKLAQPYMGIYH